MDFLPGWLLQHTAPRAQEDTYLHAPNFMAGCQIICIDVDSWCADMIGLAGVYIENPLQWLWKPQALYTDCLDPYKQNRPSSEKSKRGREPDATNN